MKDNIIKDGTRFLNFYNQSSSKSAYFFHFFNDKETNKKIAKSIELLEKTCKAENLSVLSIGPGVGHIEAFLETSGTQVLGIGKDGNKYDNEKSLLKNLFNVDVNFKCTEDSVRELFKKTALPKLGIENFEHTVLLVVMPPYNDEDNEDFAYYFQQFVAMQGQRFFLFTECLGDPNLSTPITPHKIFQKALVDKRSLDLSVYNGMNPRHSITAINFSSNFNADFEHLGAKPIQFEVNYVEPNDDESYTTASYSP